MGGSTLHVLSGHSGAVQCVSATQLNDGESSLVVTGATDRCVNVWTMLIDGPSLAMTLVAPHPPVSVCLSDQTHTHILAALESDEIIVWAIETGCEVLLCYQVEVCVMIDMCAGGEVRTRRDAGVCSAV